MELEIDQWPEKKQRIIEATITTLAKHGFNNTTTARIAKSAGVGEGTIYRYFKNKDELFAIVAVYTSALLFGPARQNFDKTATVHRQFTRFCKDFLKTGLAYPLHHAFIEQYLNSPAGIEYRKQALEAVLTDSETKPLFYPMNRILLRGMSQAVVKDLPIQILLPLAVGPLTMILRQAIQGFLELDDEMISRVAESCWDTIRRVS